MFNFSLSFVGRAPSPTLPFHFTIHPSIRHVDREIVLTCNLPFESSAFPAVRDSDADLHLPTVYKGLQREEGKGGGGGGINRKALRN